MSKPALILLGHGARDPDWKAPMQRLRDRLRAQYPGRIVENAYLQFMTPNLTDCVVPLADQGVNSVCILPVFIAQGGHVKKDISIMLDGLKQDYPRVDFKLETAVGETEAVIAALTEHAAGVACW